MDNIKSLVDSVQRLVSDLDKSPQTEKICAAAEALLTHKKKLKLSSFEDLLPACISTLTFFKENDYALDEQACQLLANCFSLINTEIEYIDGQGPMSDFIILQNQALSALSVYVTESSGFELEYCEDVIVPGANVADEVAYVEAMVTESCGGGSEAVNTSDQDVKNSEVNVASQTAAVPDKSAKKILDKTSKNVVETTRVKSYLLDQLMSHSEELVQLRNTLADIAERTEDQRISELSNRMASVSENILNDLLKTRMRPIGILLTKYKRVVRDLANDLGKKIQVEIIGENIEIDSNVIDALSEPLTHLIRNSVDHGIELPEVRRAAGKPETGVLTLHAYNEAGKVVIKISDDGKGVDCERVLAKGLERGLVPKDRADTISKKEVLNLIFKAGLSTSENVTAVSGRGVGMDAVKRKVEEIKGVIELNSELGVGTDLWLRFPLTMATLKVSLFRIEDNSYAIPSSDITQVVRFSNRDKSTTLRFDKDDGMLHRNGNIIPLIEPSSYLDNLNHHETLKNAYKAGKVINIIVFKHHGSDWGLCVDEIYAYMDIVIKPMDNTMNPVELFAGVAVLGNGELSLIINPKGLMKGIIEAKENGHNGEDLEIPPHTIPPRNGAAGSAITH